MVHGGPDLPLIQADATQIRQLLDNLVANAVQAFDGSRGRIEIIADEIVLEAS